MCRSITLHCVKKINTHKQIPKPYPKSDDSVRLMDATMSTPLICRPFDVDGADLVVHSLTKYYGGHSDVTCGVLIMSKSPSKLTQETFERARETQTTFGACRCSSAQRENLSSTYLTRTQVHHLLTVGWY